MKIKFNKSIYSKNALYESLIVWKDYIQSPEVMEDKEYYYISIKDTQEVKNISDEYVNYVLDLTSTLEAL